MELGKNLRMIFLYAPPEQEKEIAVSDTPGWGRGSWGMMACNVFLFQWRTDSGMLFLYAAGCHTLQKLEKGVVCDALGCGQGSWDAVACGIFLYR